MSKPSVPAALELILWRQYLLLLALGFTVRVLLLWHCNLPLSLPTSSMILLIGLGYDLLVASVCGLLICSAAFNQSLLRALLAVLSLVLLLVSIAELFFWNEFESRLDRLVFHYLSYPREVLTFLEDQFFLSLFALPFALLVYLLYRLLVAPLRYSAAATATPKQGAAIAVSALMGALLCNLPLNAGRIPEQLASNGYAGVLRAALTDASQWQGYYPDLVNTTALPTFVSQAPLSPTPPKHLVLVIEESFAGETWYDETLRERYLPNFVALAARSWNFSNLFATGSRTTRGMEALLNGVPPLPGVSTSQRERPERLPSLPRALAAAGWHSAFIYAGWPDFSDLTTYWRAIGFDDTTSREDFAPAANQFETSWGYADETLFERLLEEMNQRTAAHEHVFAATLTVSHHRPFDYPAGRVPFPADERRSEYAMAYADWALGEFFSRAQQTSWYADTLFVIAGDHGARFAGNASIPVNAYRVPLLMFSPGRTQPRTLSHLGSLMEVPGTLLDLLGVEDTEGFYGTHLLDARQALVAVEHDYDVGLVNAEGVTLLRRARPPETWRWQPTAAAQPLAPAPLDRATAAQVAALFKQAHQRYFDR